LKREVGQNLAVMQIGFNIKQVQLRTMPSQKTLANLKVERYAPRRTAMNHSIKQDSNYCRVPQSVV